jgi:hypothetical protein
MKGRRLMDAIEKEIRDCFERMAEQIPGVTLATTVPVLGGVFWSRSQYGVAMTGHKSQAEAEAATIAYYRERMHLIRQ